MKSLLKRTLCLLVALVVAAGLSACSSEPQSSGGSPAAGDGGKTWEVAVIAKNAESQWGIRQEQGVDRFAAETGHLAYQKGPSKVDASAQLQLLEDVIAQNVDAICIVPVDVDSVEPALERARQAGIVVIVNEGTAVQNKDYSIDAFNNEEFGEFMMESLAQQMGGEGLYTTMVGSLSNGSHNIWQDAAVAYQIEHYPNMQLLDGDPRVESGDDTETAYEKTKELLKKYPELGGVIGASSADLPGISKAVEELGLVGQIAIAGLGTPGKCQQYMVSDTLREICLWDPADAGYAMCALAVQVLEGTDIADGLDLGVNGYNSITFNRDLENCVEGAGMVLVTKETVGEYEF